MERITRDDIFELYEESKGFLYDIGIVPNHSLKSLAEIEQYILNMRCLSSEKFVRSNPDFKDEIVRTLILAAAYFTFTLCDNFDNCSWDTDEVFALIVSLDENHCFLPFIYTKHYFFSGNDFEGFVHLYKKVSESYEKMPVFC